MRGAGPFVGPDGLEEELQVPLRRGDLQPGFRTDRDGRAGPDGVHRRQDVGQDFSGGLTFRSMNTVSMSAAEGSVADGSPANGISSGMGSSNSRSRHRQASDMRSRTVQVRCTRARATPPRFESTTISPTRIEPVIGTWSK